MVCRLPKIAKNISQKIHKPFEVSEEVQIFILGAFIVPSMKNQSNEYNEE